MSAMLCPLDGQFQDLMERSVVTYREALELDFLISSLDASDAEWLMVEPPPSLEQAVSKMSLDQQVDELQAIRH